VQGDAAVDCEAVSTHEHAHMSPGAWVVTGRAGNA
jgi:hypothetical protein